MKTINTTLLFTSLLFSSLGQQNTVSTGGEVSGVGGSASFTVGQIDYINNTAFNGKINEGVQQPYEFYQEVGLEEEIIISAVYPNPTKDVIQIEFENAVLRVMNLYDQQGKLILKNETNEKYTSLDLSELAKGSYVLEVQNENKTQTIKLIKN